MKRQMVAFHLDPQNNWVADLDCGHGQQAQHNPPFENRPWTTNEEGWKSKLGVTLNCVCCEDLELPHDFNAHKQMAVFDANSVPTGLTSSHSTKTGVWAKIQGLEGRLSYEVAELISKEFVLDPAFICIVTPEILRHVRPRGPVRFYVEFYHNG